MKNCACTFEDAFIGLLGGAGPRHGSPLGRLFIARYAGAGPATKLMKPDMFDDNPPRSFWLRKR